MRETRLLLVVRTLRAGFRLLAAMATLLVWLFVPTKSAQAVLYRLYTCRPDVAAAVLDVELTFEELRLWIATDFAINQVQPALRAMANQLSAVAMHQTFIIGAMIDAKHQLETQRLFQELQTQAHKDYQPSTSFCTFGTAARSLAHSEAIGRYNALALSKRQMARHLGQQGMAGASGGGDDKEARWKHFTETYCDPQDNNWNAQNPNSSGLARVCQAGSGNSDRVNIDIDYTRMIENRRTLDISYPAYVNAPDEEDVIALGNNLYGSNVQFREVSPANADDPKYTHRYMSLRSVAAKRSVAENSFNAIVGMKSLGTTTNQAGTTQTYRYLGAILRDLGIPENEVKQYLGLDPNSPRATNPPDYIPDPSYYAQLEILAKKIYQNPSFYSNLYDTPANVKRKSAALKAIELMLDRAIYESQLRQEMAMSVLLSTKLEKSYDSVNTRLNK
jgi:hypothetical protein